MNRTTDSNQTAEGHRNYRWYRLDNAAMIVPSTSHGADTRVFRITCELTERVDPKLLQEALDETMEEFPHLRTCLRKGFFWYHFDETPEKPVVKEDNRPVCAALYIPGRRSMLFRVVYTENRVSLEMFHAVADGTGGLVFLRKLICRYLEKKHHLNIPSCEHESSSIRDKAEDAFRRYYTTGKQAVHNYEGSAKTGPIKPEGEKKKKTKSQLFSMTTQRAYHIPMEKDLSLRCHCVECTVSASRYRELAKSHGATVGIDVVAVYIQALCETMNARDAKRPIVISVPVNLRQYFPSETTRNFFNTINVRYDPHEYDGTLDSILPVVRKSFEEQLSPERIKDTMNRYSTLIHNLAVRAIPLFLKDIGINRFFYLSKAGITATLSNLGKISMPEKTVPYIRLFAGYMSTPNMQICVSTFGDRMVFGIVTAYTEYTLLPAFVRKLTEAGLDVEIGSNDCDLRKENGHAVLSQM